MEVKKISIRRLVIIGIIAGVLYGASLFGLFWNATITTRHLEQDWCRQQPIETFSQKSLFHDGYMRQCSRVQGSNTFFTSAIKLERGGVTASVNLEASALSKSSVAASNEECNKLAESYYRRWGRTY